MNSCKSALEHGILPGGGTSFIHSLKVLEKKLEETKNGKINNEFNYDNIVGIIAFIKAIKVN